MSCHEPSSDPLACLLPGMFARGFDLSAWLKVSVIQAVHLPMTTARTCGSTSLARPACARISMIKRVLASMRPGLVVEIVSDNLSVVETIPFMLPGHDCVHLATVHLDDCWKIFAKKAGT
jgi:TusA-related sulfurtransferase